MATTFVDKVILKRQEDYDTAWEKFSMNVTQGNIHEKGFNRKF